MQRESRKKEKLERELQQSRIDVENKMTDTKTLQGQIDRYRTDMGKMEQQLKEQRVRREGEGKGILDILYLRAPVRFEHWQSINKGLPLGSVKDHLGSIGGVKASCIQVVLDGISPSSFGATSWSFPAMNYWVECHRPFVQGGSMACGGDVRTSVGGVVVGEMMRLVAWCVHGCFGC